MMLVDAYLSFELSVTEPGRVIADRPQRLVIEGTGSSQTSLPASVTPTSILDPGTGDLRLARDLAIDAGDALRYARVLAVLPIDAEHERRIDALVDARVHGIASKRSLARPR